MEFVSEEFEFAVLVVAFGRFPWQPISQVLQGVLQAKAVSFPKCLILNVTISAFTVTAVLIKNRIMF